MRPFLLTLAIGGVLASAPVAADTLTYSGRLEAGNGPANGHYDLRLEVHGDAKHGAALAAPMEFPAVPVVDGAFRVEFDLPPGRDEAWVALSIRAQGDAGWSAIPGRTRAIAAPKAIGQCWSSTGDDGSNPALNFLGTTDAQPLVLRTRNAQSLRIEPSSVLFTSNPITANIVAGSSTNVVEAGTRGATIGGGGAPSTGDPDFDEEGPNVIADHYGVIGGGFRNVAGDQLGTRSDAALATIAGGSGNTASGFGSSIGGGIGNRASGDADTVGGGLSNSASGALSVVDGGGGNTASGVRSVVGGGGSNLASAELSLVGGGSQNVASAFASTVVGGSLNAATGNLSTAGGGSSNCAGGARSWAGGNRAKVRPGSNPGFASCDGLTYPGGSGDQGTFVWADSQDANFVSTGPDQFLVRAGGGVAINSNVLFAAGDDLVLRARPQTGDADADFRLVSRSGKNALLYLVDSTGGLFVEVPGLAAGGIPRLQVNGPTGGIATLSNGGTWTNASSRRYKSDFLAIDPLDVLARLLALPISRWSYTGSSEGVHLGPMAEDFKAAFGLAGDGTSIATVDADGVALAAIQGLNAKLEAENAALKARIEALERAVLGRGTAE